MFRKSCKILYILQVFFAKISHKRQYFRMYNTIGCLLSHSSKIKSPLTGKSLFFQKFSVVSSDRRLREFIKNAFHRIWNNELFDIRVPSKPQCNSIDAIELFNGISCKNIRNSGSRTTSRDTQEFFLLEYAIESKLFQRHLMQPAKVSTCTSYFKTRVHNCQIKFQFRTINNNACS